MPRYSVQDSGGLAGQWNQAGTRGTVQRCTEHVHPENGEPDEQEATDTIQHPGRDNELNHRLDKGKQLPAQDSGSRPHQGAEKNGSSEDISTWTPPMTATPLLLILDPEVAAAAADRQTPKQHAGGKATSQPLRATPTPYPAPTLIPAPTYLHQFYSNSHGAEMQGNQALIPDRE